MDSALIVSSHTRFLGHGDRVAQQVSEIIVYDEEATRSERLLAALPLLEARCGLSDTTEDLIELTMRLCGCDMALVTPIATSVVAAAEHLLVGGLRSQ